MSESVKAKPVDPYATRIPGRNKPFKTHRTLGQAKAAFSLHLDRDRNRARYGYAYLDDGIYRASMTLYRLNAELGEYEPLVIVQKGDRRSQHPELMPKLRRATAEPSDEQERAAISAVHALRWECTCPVPGDPHKPWCLGLAKNTLLNQLGANQ